MDGVHDLECLVLAGTCCVVCSRVLRCAPVQRKNVVVLEIDMMIIKSLALGLGLFFFGTIAYLAIRLYTPSTTTATSINVYKAYTIWNVWYWLSLVATLGVAYWIVRRFSAAG